MQIDIYKENHMLKADLRKVQYDRDMVMNLDCKVKKLKAKMTKILVQKTVTIIIVNNNYGLKDEILLSLVKYDIQVAKKISYTACSLGKL